MDYVLEPVSEADKEWLDSLRRAAYRDLFDATWGRWDEVRHQRHFSESWDAGHISLIQLNQSPAGMLQLLESGDQIEIAEIQILPVRQNRGLGSKILEDVITKAKTQNKKLTLHLGRQNDRALRLYRRLGFTETGRSDTHIFMAYSKS